MSIESLHAWEDAGFIAVEHPNYLEPVFEKTVVASSMPDFVPTYIDGALRYSTDEILIEACPDGTLKVSCTKSGFSKTLAIASKEGEALVTEALAAASIDDQDERVSGPITSMVISDEDLRMGFLPKYFGLHFMVYENLLYSLAKRFFVSDSYRGGSYGGGFWDYIELSNGGAYARIRFEGQIEIASPNGTVEVMSADGASLVVNSFVQGLLAERTEDDYFIRMHRRLTDFALRNHEDAAAFEALVD